MDSYQLANITPRDVELFASHGVSSLITTTPEIGGRSFGTNVIEAALLAMHGKKWEEVTPADYERLVRELNLRPRVVELQTA